MRNETVLKPKLIIIRYSLTKLYFFWFFIMSTNVTVQILYLKTYWWKCWFGTI